jgi:phosphate uptake regulator
MPQIEERTISKVGGSSLMVTLPKGWLRFHRIKAGDKVEVVSNGELRIRPKRKARKGAAPPGKVLKDSEQVQA